MGMFVAGEDKILSYNPKNFHIDSDVSSDGESQNYTVKTSKMKVLSKTMGSISEAKKEEKRLMYINEEDLKTLRQIEAENRKKKMTSEQA